MRTFGWVLSLQEDQQFAVLGLILSLLTIISVTLLLQLGFHDLDARILWILIIAGPCGIIIFHWVGRNDVLMITGSLLVALSHRRWWLVASGLILMVGANPEQSVFAWLALVCLTFMPNLQNWRRLSILGFAASATAFVALSFWSRTSGPGDRSRFLDDFLANSLHNFLANLPLSIYALFGVLWPVVILLLVSGGRSELVIFALTFFPALILTAITLDQTRVFVGISTLALFVWLQQRIPETQKLTQESWLQHRLGWVVAISVVLPAIEIFGPSGLPRGPYAFLFDFLFG